jgi:ribosomal subunit interface protein
MRIQITGRHCDVPKTVLERTETQITALAKYEERASAADVVYTEEKQGRRVEVMIHIDGSEAVVAHGEGDSFRSALDQVVERARRMLRKQRERRRDHQAPPLSEVIEAE